MYVLALHRGVPGSSTEVFTAGCGDAPHAPGAVPPPQKEDQFSGFALKKGSKSGNSDLDEMEAVFGRKKGGTASAAAPIIQVPYFGRVGEMEYAILLVPTADIITITVKKLKVDAAEVLDAQQGPGVSRAVQALQAVTEEAGEDALVAVDAVRDLKLNELDVVETYMRRQVAVLQMAQFECHRCPKLPEQYALIHHQHKLKQRISRLQFEMSDASLQQMPEYHQRMEVLKHMGYVDQERVVQMKGRVMCELNSCDELLGSEMIFAGVLGELDADEAVALLSALIFQEKSDAEPTLNDKLAEARQTMIKLAQAAGTVQRDCGLDILPEEYCRSVLNFTLMEVVYEWARGTPFADICQLTDVPEGSVVRAIVRLDEACREVKDAARLMGDSTLFLKMQQASEHIKRDIVFSASLYVSKA